MADYAAFGGAGDLPLMGSWTTAGQNIPAVLHKLSDKRYQLAGFSDHGLLNISRDAHKRSMVFAGDVDGDDITDLVFAEANGRIIRWTGILAPLLSRWSIMRSFSFGEVGDPRFLLQWREKYKNFAVLEHTRGHHRAIRITHCMKGCRRVRSIRLSRSLLNGFDPSHILGIAGRNRRESSFLLESLDFPTRNPVNRGHGVIVVTKIGNIDLKYDFSEPGTVLAGRFSPDNTVVHFGLVAVTSIVASSFYDEFGNATSDDVWTGSATGDGMYDGLDCNGWTSGSSGLSGLVSWYGNWFWGEDGSCDQQHHFYCIKGY